MAKTNEELEKELQLMIKNIDQAKKVHEQCTTRLIQIQAILQDRASQAEEQKEAGTEVVRKGGRREKGGEEEKQPESW